MGKVIAIASGKGGTGKTTTVAALSSCLAELGFKTLCVDFSVGLRNLDLALCLDDNTDVSFADVLNNRFTIAEASQEHPKIPNLYFLSAPSDHIQSELSTANLTQMFTEIRNEFDYCLIDCPAGLGEHVRMAHMNVDLSIIVTNCDLPAVRNAQKTADTIRAMGVSEIRLIMNRVKKNGVEKLWATVDETVDMTGVQLIGVIPEDESVFLALHKNTLLINYKNRFAINDFMAVARRITGEDVPSRIRVWRHSSSHQPALSRRTRATGRRGLQQSDTRFRSRQIATDQQIRTYPPTEVTEETEPTAADKAAAVKVTTDTPKPAKPTDPTAADKAAAAKAITDTAKPAKPTKPVKPTDPTAAAKATTDPTIPAKPTDSTEPTVIRPEGVSPQVFQEYFGNPELWAKSTLQVTGNENLVKILTVKQHKYAARESVRNRMWLHDILDDNGIPYHIEVEGYWPGRRRFAEMQNIFIEEKHQQEARRLIISYNNPGNYMLENLEEEAISSGNMVEGVPQRTCQFCGREIDFDYQKCPYCKGQVVSDS